MVADVGAGVKKLPDAISFPTTDKGLRKGPLLMATGDVSIVATLHRLKSKRLL